MVTEAGPVQLEARHTREAKRTRLSKTRLVAPLVAGLLLAACSGGGAPSAASSAPSTTLETTTMPSTSATSTPETSAPGSDTTSSSSLPAPNAAGCAKYFNLSKYHNHEFEVCTAYVANTGEIALRGLYEFGNNSSGVVTALAQHHFETRYWDQARQAIEQRVAGWPHTTSVAGNDVDASIAVDSLSSSLAADRAVLQTSESWHVTAPGGAVLYNEPRQALGVTMCRGKLPFNLPNGTVLHHPLHEWVVVSLEEQPNFDCLSFDRAHNIVP